LVGAISGDAVSLTGGTATFSDKNVGTGKTVTLTGAALSGADAGNYILDSVATAKADITALHITGSFTASSKPYDGNATATVLTRSLVGAISGDAVSLTGGTAMFSDKNVGTGKTVTLTGAVLGGADAGNYILDSVATVKADITALHITGSFTASNKVYDGNASATVLTRSLNATISGDVVSLYGGTASFSDKNVGTGKTVSLTGSTLTGTDAGNYILDSVATANADITARPLKVYATGVDKVYDGTTTATVTLSDNRISGDVFTDSYSTATFADKNVGTAKPVSVTGISISGTDAGNYALQNTTAATTANITQRPLAVSATGIDKVYDGTTTATVTLSDDRIAGDAITDAYTSAAFNSKTVGTTKTVNVSGISISGTDAGNYSLQNTTANTTANITARPLTITATGVDKVYDGTSTATVTLSDDRIAGDLFTDSYSAASFATKNAGIAKTVNVTGISISGADAGNYTFNMTATTTANITARPLKVYATGVDKVYDGNTTATVTLSDNRISGDIFTDSYSSATFADKNVGSGKAVTVTGISISGTDAGNYDLQNMTANTTANITARDLTVTAHGVNKQYDGNTTATVTLSDDRVSGDSLTDNYTSATFADKNVANGKTVSVSGISISGTDVANYHLLNTTASTTADITARTLTISATGVNKVYDGTTAATVSLSDGRIPGDVFTDSYNNATFADKNVGAIKTVSVSGISIAGADAGNYTFNTTASTSADITARKITVTAAPDNKTYDGTVSSTGTPTVTYGSVVAGDTPNFTQAFDSRNAGTRVVTPSGSVTDGNGGNNYAVTFKTAAGTISPLGISVNAVTDTKVYDGNVNSTGIPTIVPALIAPDTAGFTQTFDTKNAGSRTLTPSGSVNDGNGGQNYAPAFHGVAGSITQRPVTVTADAKTKVYGDVDPALTYGITSGSLVAGDGFSGSLTRVAGENVGPYAIQVGTLTLGGNYMLTYVGANLSITSAPLTITPDGNKTKTLGAVFTAFTGAVSGLKFSDAVTVTYASAGAPAAAGVGSYNITVGSYNFTTGSAANYTITQNTAVGGLKVLYASAGICAGDSGHAIRQPINPDGTSVFKLGSTVPTKFAVCDANGNSIGTPGVVTGYGLVAMAAATSISVDETVYSTTPDTTFRWDPTGMQWIFNQSTKNNGSLNKSGVLYYFVINLNDGTSISFAYALK
jgi:hypothetical protein